MKAPPTALGDLARRGFSLFHNSCCWGLARAAMVRARRPPSARPHGSSDPTHRRRDVIISSSCGRGWAEQLIPSRPRVGLGRFPRQWA